MRRLSLPAPGELAWLDLEDRALAPREMRLRTTLTGISAGTEISKYRGTLPGGVTSWERLGYQLVGVVTEVGPDVDAVAVGDRVFAHAPHADQTILDTDTGRFFVVDPHVPDEDAVVGALATVAIRGVQRVRLEVGESVCVVGLGTLGLAFLQVARAFGAGMVVGCDVQPEKLALARILGADHALAPGDGFAAAIGGLTGRVGVDVVAEAVGEASPSGFATALAAADIGGRVLALSGTLANVSGGETVSAKELSIVGTRSDGGASPTGRLTPETTRRAQENLRVAGRLITAGLVRGAPLVTHRFPAASVVDAYRMIDGRTEPFTLVLLDWS